MSISLMGTRNKKYPNALLAITVKNLEYAKRLQVYFGKWTYDDRYVYTGFKQTIDHFYEVKQILQDTYNSWLLEDQ